MPRRFENENITVDCDYCNVHKVLTREEYQQELDMIALEDFGVDFNHVNSEQAEQVLCEFVHMITFEATHKNN